MLIAGHCLITCVGFANGRIEISLIVFVLFSHIFLCSILCREFGLIYNGTVRVEKWTPVITPPT
jgi:hypothetical protein